MPRDDARLLLGQRGAERGDRAVEPRLMQGDNIHIALGQNKIAALCRLGKVERKQVAALVEDRRLGRIEVLGLGVVQHAPAKRDHVAAHIDDWEHHAVTEPVVNTPLFAAADKARVHQLVARVALGDHCVHERMERIRRIAKAEPIHRAAGQAAADKILLRRAVFRLPQGIIEKPRRILTERVQPLAVARRLAVGLALLGHLHARARGEEAHRVREFQPLGLHHKGDHAAARAAAEAVEDLLIRRDRE